MLDKFDRLKRLQKEKVRLLGKSPLCRWCRRVVTAKMASLEHVHPLSLGGTDARSNLALACKKCNAARGNNVRWSHRNASPRSSTAERIPYTDEVRGSTPLAGTTTQSASTSAAQETQ